MEQQTYHIPVMLEPTLEGLNIKENGIYVDVTFGGGGHSRAILNRLNNKGKLIAFDQDMDAMQNAINDPRFIFVRSNFKYLKNFLRYHGINKVDGILADLGVSSHHFDDEERGFSFRFDSKLDMRMNKKASKTAADILNSYNERQLSDLFYFYGELQQAKKLAKAIVEKRNTEEFSDIASFIETIKAYIPKEREKKDLAKVFQALRIEVNKEMDALKALLQQVPDVLNDEGRLVVLTYHSLEDRLVKNFIKTGNFEGKQEKDFFGKVLSPLKAINNKVIIATDEEVMNNPRARSAKLRIAQKNLH